MPNTPDWWRRPRTVTVVCDTPGWFDSFAEDLVARLNRAGDDARLVRSAAEAAEGAIAFYLSCMRIVTPEALARNRLNIVVHASDLPKGRGFSPLAWLVLEGASEIPVTMIEMAEEVDAGDILMQRVLPLEGHELNDEMRDALGRVIVHMCAEVLDAPLPPEGRPQQGAPSWRPRRRPADSRLDAQQTLAEQFDLFRVVDNERYPAYLEHRGWRYALRIEKLGPVESDLKQNGLNNGA